MAKTYTKYNWVVITIIIPKGGKLPDNYISSGHSSYIYMSACIHTYTHMRYVYDWQISVLKWKKSTHYGELIKQQCLENSSTVYMKNLGF